jgi:hypothetical protein
MELKTQDSLFDDVGMSFGRPEITPPINKSSQGLQFRVHVLRAARTHTFLIEIVGLHHKSQ